MELNVPEEKTKAMVERYNKDDAKGSMTRKEYAYHLAKNDPQFVPWLFNFEQREERSDLSTGMTHMLNSALDNWVDIYNNY